MFDNRLAGGLGCFVLFLGIALVAMAFISIRYAWRSSQLEVFEPDLPKYLAAMPEHGAVPMGGAHKHGVITVNVQTRQLDHLYFDLPDELSADTPAQVKTVVFLRWSKIRTQTFRRRGGYTHTCEVSIVDLETKALLHREELRGSPPSTIFRRRRGPTHGSRPAPEIVNFVHEKRAR